MVNIFRLYSIDRDMHIENYIALKEIRDTFAIVQLKWNQLLYTHIHVLLMKSNVSVLTTVPHKAHFGHDGRKHPLHALTHTFFRISSIVQILCASEMILVRISSD